LAIDPIADVALSKTFLQFALMKRRLFPILLVAIASLSGGAATAQRLSPEPGDEYIITKSYQTAQETSEGSSSGSANGRDDYLERIIAVGDTGVELEYDLRREATAEDRARSWQFPVRVLKPINGPMQVLNEQELEARLDRWLNAAKWTREVCGHWIFTWNAFRIECDPTSVLTLLDTVNLRSLVLREGSAHSEPEALGTGILTRKASPSTNAIYTVDLDVDSEAVRRARAESDVAVGEIMREPVTFDAALENRRSESISGTISITFDTDSSGNVWRRTKVTKLVIKKPDGLSENQIATETVERRSAIALSSGPE
jgi:hypothetical protein